MMPRPAIALTEKRARLYFMCGKMAAGKSTLARELARTKDALLLVLDDFFEVLYPGEIRSIQDFVRCSARVRNALAPHIRDLLSRGVSVVLDFPGNTRTQRQWFRKLLEGTRIEHELHFIDAPDDLCKRQLRQRSAALPAGSAWTTDAEFDALTAYFQPPAADEHFNVIRHERTCPDGESMRVSLRPAVRPDIPALQRVRLAVRENRLSDPTRITEADYVAAMEELGRTWVVEDGGEIVAFASGYATGSVWALFVHPNHEGRGHGKALHAAMVEWLWSLGHSRLWLTTEPGSRAERFYLAQGWQPAGTMPEGELRLELSRPPTRAGSAE